MIKLKTILPATPQQIYNAWLSGKGHTAMTGAKATGSKKIGGKFTAWDGYISGTNEKLVENKTIVQHWRTSEFSDRALDSKLVIELKAVQQGTQLTLTHTNTPKAQEASYKQGWQEHYFEPMQAYFKIHRS